MSEHIKKGIIFDMDGTLWDSAEGVAESWNEILSSKGYTNINITEKDIKGVMGMTMKDIADALLNFAGDGRYDLCDACTLNENVYLSKYGAVLYPDLEQTFKILLERSYKLYIVSNCQKGYVESFLDYYDFWHYVEDIECYGNNLKNKGENIALIAERNKLDIAMYVGDIQSDYDSSVKAGVPFIYAAYGFGEVDADVPLINGLNELPDVADTVIMRYNA